MGEEKLLIVIPALNESATIEGVIHDIRKNVENPNILVIDDGSTDETSLVAKQSGVETIRLPFNLGVGGAMRTAFKYAKAQGFETVIQIVGDGQHDASYIPELLKESNAADIVIASRFKEKSNYKIGVLRKSAINLIRALFKKTTGLKLTDPTSGFKLSGKKAIDLYSEIYPSYYLGDTIGALALASSAKLSIKEIPTVMRERQGGSASQSSLRLLSYFLRILLVTLIYTFKIPTAKGEEK